MTENYNSIKTIEEATIWFKKNYSEYMKQIHNDSHNEKTLGYSLFVYTGSMSKDYNRILESNNGKIDNIDKYIDEFYKIDNHIENNYNNYLSKSAKFDIKKIYESFDNVIRDNIYLYHYFNYILFRKKIKNGDIIQLNKFISTTCLKKTEGIKKLSNERKYDTLLKIRVKKGTKCIPIGNNPNSLLREYEVILKPQSKIRILKIRKSILSRIKYNIECELL
ncbi:MAG: hypothetical protein ACI31V_05520 [Bacilli bacterium]